MIWIDTQEAFDAAMTRLAAQPVIAIDTEADSLHSYFDKVCLIQISVPGEDLVIDPLAGIALGAFGELLRNEAITKLFHGGDYDLRILHRDFNFTVTNLIDTMVSAQILGYQAFGLAALLDRHFGLKLNKAHQRADWAMRPLTPDMLAYAATDTHYLIRLAEILRGELEALGRWEWAVEEFGRLGQVRYREASDEDAEPWRKLKGIGVLDRRSLGVLNALYEWRDGLARQADRPPFKIIGNDALLDIAREKPQNREELTRIKSVSRYHSGRFGAELAALVRKAMELDESTLPARGEAKAWIRDKTLEARVDRLKKVRDRIASDLKIEPSVLAPRHVLTAIAMLDAPTFADLDQIPAMREWQKRVAGAHLLASLRPNENRNPPEPEQGTLGF
jgi:ribonuclease D